MVATLFFLSMAGGFLSGLIGIGGAVVLIPLLHYVPPVLGFGLLSMREVAGITMIQVLAASVFGWLAHKRNGFVHIPTVLAIGIPMGILALCGAALSKFISNENICLFFGAIVLIAFFLLFKKASDEISGSSDEFKFKPFLSAIIGSVVGFVTGIVGAGGGFIIIPLMIVVLGVPMRLAVGSSLGIVFLGSLMGSVGKIATSQVAWRFLAPVILGSVPAALIGAFVSKKLSPTCVRYVLIIFVFLTLVVTWADILRRFIGLS
ncbi:MAG: sulfite exporter TauE/SafE family protein [Lentisphaerae bacterium]|nr:sulfite exporter TauE/SafE family protein [Lentisphaerota bacterium]